jgi:hypothetical protein
VPAERFNEKGICMRTMIAILVLLCCSMPAVHADDYPPDDYPPVAEMCETVDGYIDWSSCNVYYPGPANQRYDCPIMPGGAELFSGVDVVLIDQCEYNPAGLHNGYIPGGAETGGIVYEGERICGMLGDVVDCWFQLL